MQVYSAKQLFDVFSKRQEVTVHLERPVAEVDPTQKRGRVDMTLEFGKDALYAIEFKRYSNPAEIGADLTRLRGIAAKSGTVGLLAAPCYMEGTSEGEDWPLRDKRRNEARNPSEIWHLSEPKTLPNHSKHITGITHERTLVIEVCSSSKEGSLARS
jgi:hypothetical protein